MTKDIRIWGKIDRHFLWADIQSKSNVEYHRKIIKRNESDENIHEVIIIIAKDHFDTDDDN